MTHQAERSLGRGAVGGLDRRNHVRALLAGQQSRRGGELQARLADQEGAGEQRQGRAQAPAPGREQRRQDSCRLDQAVGGAEAGVALERLDLCVDPVARKFVAHQLGGQAFTPFCGSPGTDLVRQQVDQRHRPIEGPTGAASVGCLLHDDPIVEA